MNHVLPNTVHVIIPWTVFYLWVEHGSCYNNLFYLWVFYLWVCVPSLPWRAAPCLGWSKVGVVLSWFYFFHTLQEQFKLISFQPRHQRTTCCAASTCYNWIHCELSYRECSLACMYTQRWPECTCVQAYMQYVRWRLFCPEGVPC